MTIHACDSMLITYPQFQIKAIPFAGLSNYNKCAIMEIIALLSIRVNVLLLL